MEVTLHHMRCDHLAADGQTQGSGRPNGSAWHAQKFAGGEINAVDVSLTLLLSHRAQAQLMALMLKAAGPNIITNVSLSLVSCMRTNWLGWSGYCNQGPSAIISGAH